MHWILPLLRHIVYVRFLFFFAGQTLRPCSVYRKTETSWFSAYTDPDAALSSLFSLFMHHSVFLCYNMQEKFRR